MSNFIPQGMGSTKRAHLRKGTDVAYRENAINADLRENMADDPYGTATFVIVEMLRAAATYSGTMSEYEYQVLVKIASVLDDCDYHRSAVKAMQAELP